MDRNADATRAELVIADASYPDDAVEREAAGRLGVAVRRARVDGPAGLPDAVGAAEGVLVQLMPIDAALLDRCPTLRVLGRYGVGVDDIDVAAASARGIAVVNVPDYATEEVASHAAALILAVARRLPEAERLVRAGRWDDWAALRPIAPLSESTLGLVGVGRIGVGAGPAGRRPVRRGAGGRPGARRSARRRRAGRTRRAAAPQRHRLAPPPAQRCDAGADRRGGARPRCAPGPRSSTSRAAGSSTRRRSRPRSSAAGSGFAALDVLDAEPPPGGRAAAALGPRAAHQPRRLVLGARDAAPAPRARRPLRARAARRAGRQRRQPRGAVTELAGPRVRLTPLDAGDAAALRAIHADPAVAAWWDEPEQDFPLADEPEAMRFTIHHRGEIAGMIQYGEELEPKYRHASVDLFVAPSHHRQGVASEAIALVVDHLIGGSATTASRSTRPPRTPRRSGATRRRGFRPVGLLRRAERDSRRRGLARRAAHGAGRGGVSAPPWTTARLERSRSLRGPRPRRRRRPAASIATVRGGRGGLATGRSAQGRGAGTVRGRGATARRASSCRVGGCAYGRAIAGPRPPRRQTRRAPLEIVERDDVAGARH